MLYLSAVRSILVRQCPLVQRKCRQRCLGLGLGKVLIRVPCSVRLNYTWINQDRKSVQLPAPTYIDYVMTWVQNLLDDENTFPTKSGNFDLSPPVPHVTHSCIHPLIRPRLPRLVPVNHQARLSSAPACIRAYIPRTLPPNPSPAFRTSLQLALRSLPCVRPRVRVAGHQRRSRCVQRAGGRDWRALGALERNGYS